MLERGQLDAGAREQRGVVGVEEPAHGEQHAGAAAREHERGLRALNRVLTGTSTPPAVVTPSAATIHSSEFGAHTATRSPGSMPDAISARAAPSTSSRSAAKSMRAVAVDDRVGVGRSGARRRGPSPGSSAR